jgi:hypothetical protein
MGVVPVVRGGRARRSGGRRLRRPLPGRGAALAEGAADQTAQCVAEGAEQVPDADTADVGGGFQAALDIDLAGLGTGQLTHQRRALGHGQPSERVQRQVLGLGDLHGPLPGRPVGRAVPGRPVPQRDGQTQVALHPRLAPGEGDAVLDRLDPVGKALGQATAGPVPPSARPGWPRLGRWVTGSRSVWPTGSVMEARWVTAGVGGSYWFSLRSSSMSTSRPLTQPSPSQSST